MSDPTFGGTRALVIDGNPSMRRATVLQLRDLGIGQVRQSKGLADARFSLEQMDFDFVLCADVIEGSELTGQSLLEELRREAILPYGTVFVMIATEATYVKVVEAAEAALDCFVLRPYRVAELAERLRAARRRKRELSPVFDAIAKPDLPLAIERCLLRYQGKMPYAVHCARMAAELQLKTGQVGQALSLFQQLVQETKLPWARLGVARAQMAAGDPGAARKQVEQLIKQQPMMAEAYDVLARVQVDQGELRAALRTCHSVSEITPGCMLRLQQAGTLAFYLNDRELAVEMLDRAVALGARSRLFDAFTLMLLALLRADMGDMRRLTLMHGALKQYRGWHPGSKRLQRFERGAGALRALLGQQLDEAQTEVLALGATAADEDFDLEAANVVLALWVRLPERDVGAGAQDQIVRQIAMRFCISKSISDILVASARQHPVITPLIRSCQAEVTLVAEEALRLAMQQQQPAAVRLLIDQGASTRNARLIEMAGLLMHRHRSHLPDCDAWLAEATALHQRYCRPITHIAGMRRSGRQAGGLLLRGQAFGPATDPDPMAGAPDTTPADDARSGPQAPPDTPPPANVRPDLAEPDAGSMLMAASAVQGAEAMPG